jgi:hypothetical protein
VRRKRSAFVAVGNISSTGVGGDPLLDSVMPATSADNVISWSSIFGVKPVCPREPVPDPGVDEDGGEVDVEVPEDERKERPKVGPAMMCGGTVDGAGAWKKERSSRVSRKSVRTENSVRSVSGG